MPLTLTSQQEDWLKHFKRVNPHIGAGEVQKRFQEQFGIQQPQVPKVTEVPVPGFEPRATSPGVCAGPAAPGGAVPRSHAQSSDLALAATGPTEEGERRQGDVARRHTRDGMRRWGIEREAQPQVPAWLTGATEQGQPVIREEPQQQPEAPPGIATADWQNLLEAIKPTEEPPIELGEVIDYREDVSVMRDWKAGSDVALEEARSLAQRATTERGGLMPNWAILGSYNVPKPGWTEEGGIKTATAQYFQTEEQDPARTKKFVEGAIAYAAEKGMIVSPELINWAKSEEKTLKEMQRFAQQSGMKKPQTLAEAETLMGYNAPYQLTAEQHNILRGAVPVTEWNRDAALWAGVPEYFVEKAVKQGTNIKGAGWSPTDGGLRAFWAAATDTLREAGIEPYMFGALLEQDYEERQAMRGGLDIASWMRMPGEMGLVERDGIPYRTLGNWDDEGFMPASGQRALKLPTSREELAGWAPYLQEPVETFGIPGLPGKWFIDEKGNTVSTIGQELPEELTGRERTLIKPSKALEKLIADREAGRVKEGAPEEWAGKDPYEVMEWWRSDVKEHPEWYSDLLGENVRWDYEDMLKYGAENFDQFLGQNIFELIRWAEHDPLRFFQAIVDIGPTREAHAILMNMGFGAADVDAIFPEDWRKPRAAPEELGVGPEEPFVVQQRPEEGIGEFDYRGVYDPFTGLPRAKAVSYEELGKEEQERQDIADRLYLSGVQIGHRAKGFGLQLLPTLLFGEGRAMPTPSAMAAPHLKWAVDPLGQLLSKTEAYQENTKIVRDYFRRIWAEQQAEHTEWLKEHPELEPSEQLEKVFWEAPENLRNINYWMYQFASIIPFMAAAMGAATITGFATKNPIAAMGAGSVVALPIESQDLFVDLLEMGVAEDDAADTAIRVGSLIAAIECLGEVEILRLFAPAARKALLHGLKDATVGTIARRLLRTGVERGGKTWFFEVVEEGAQEILHNFGLWLHDNEQDIMANVPEVLGKAAIGMAPMALLAGTVNVGVGTNEWIKMRDEEVARPEDVPKPPLDEAVKISPATLKTLATIGGEFNPELQEAAKTAFHEMQQTGQVTPESYEALYNAAQKTELPVVEAKAAEVAPEEAVVSEPEFGIKTPEERALEAKYPGHKVQFYGEEGERITGDAFDEATLKTISVKAKTREEAARLLEAELGKPTEAKPIPKAVEGEPEAGFQAGMLGEGKMVMPKGKGKPTQITMDTALKYQEQVNKIAEDLGAKRLPKGRREDLVGQKAKAQAQADLSRMWAGEGSLVDRFDEIQNELGEIETSLGKRTIPYGRDLARDTFRGVPTAELDERWHIFRDFVDQFLTEGIAGEAAIAKGAYEPEALPPSPKAEPGRITKQSDIISELSEKLNVPIRRGHFREKAKGIYKKGEEIIRIKTGTPARTVAHEVGHLLDDRYQLSRHITNKELNPLLEEYPKPENKHKEALGEFLRFYITEPAKAQKKAPKFHKFFEETMETYPDVRDILLTARRDYGRWLNLPSTAKIAAQISTEEGEAGATVKERLNDLYTAAWDDLYPIRDFVKTAKKAGVEIETEEDPYVLARLMRGQAGRSNAFLEKGTFGRTFWKVEDGKTVPSYKGKSLQAILKPIEEHLVDFRIYLVARRAVSLDKRAIETGIAVDDATTSVRELNTKYPKFTDVAQELYTYQRHILEYAQESGLISEDLMQTLDKVSKDYVPFYRIMEEMQARGYHGKGFANVRSPVKRMKGSERDIIDPLESIVKNTYAIMDAADRNQVGVMLARMAEKDKVLSQMFEKIPAPMAKVASVSAKELGVDLIDELTEEQLDATVNIFRPAVFSSADNILSVMIGGKKTFYQVDGDLYKGIAAMEREDIGIITKILSYPAKWLRAGAVLSPDFWIAKNPMRDTMTAFAYSKYGFIPFLDTLRGTFAMVKRDQDYQLWRTAGGERSMLVSMDRQYLQKSFKEVLKGREAVEYVKHPLETLQIFAELTESGTRIGEMKRGLQAGASPIEAAFASREVSLDFAVRGAKTRAWNMITAFFNANMRAMDKLVRESYQAPHKFWPKVMFGITLPSILLYLAQRDDPRWDEIPEWQKNLFWIIFTEKNIWRIPKPFELGIIFGSGPVAILEYFDKKDRRILDEFSSSALSSMNPGFIPTGLLPVIENMSNYNFFLERKIVPDYQADFPAKLQYSLWTPEMIKKLGDWANYSPRKIENLLHGYTAGLGRYAVKVLDEILQGTGILPSIPEPTATLADMPVVKALIVRNPYGSGSGSVTRFYDKLEELTKHEKYLKQMLKEGNQRKFVAYRDKHAEVMFVPDYEAGGGYSQAARYLRKVRYQLSELRSRQRDVYTSPTLTPDEKRETIDAIDILLTETAKNAVEYLKKGPGD